MASSMLSSYRLRAAVACLPIAIWARDSLVSLYKVEGTSMEPTLRHGDVLLVRKCDVGMLLEVLLSLFVGDPPHDMERARLVRYESLQGVTTHVPVSRIYETPPLALTGQVVLFHDPFIFPPQLNIKRVIGVGGQYVRSTDMTTTTPATFRNRRRTLSVPPYSIYVEGDNLANSTDSRQMGPITKGLLVGVAEYVVWPPSRWRRLRRLPAQDDQGNPRAYWP